MRPKKITFGDMREMGVGGVLIYCADYRCSHSVTISADRWPDKVRLSDIEPRFVCGRRGADGLARIQLGKAARSGDGGIDRARCADPMEQQHRRKPAISGGPKAREESAMRRG